MRLAVVCSVLFCAATLYAQMEMNVSQLADFVRSELALRQHSDKQVAAYLKRVKLSEQLSPKTIADLEAQGAGPKTVEALNSLREQSASLKKTGGDVTSSPATAGDDILTNSQPNARLSVNAAPLPAPDSIHQQQILDSMKQYAANYTQNLPNFICVQVTRQGVDLRGGDQYQTIGRILSRVSYNEGHESYSVYSVNGRLVNASMDTLHNTGGAVSSGEFGSLMSEIFASHSQAEFNWDHWAKLRGRVMEDFNYYIDSGHSAWSIAYSSGPGDEQRIYTAYKGLIYADANTGEIDRIQFNAVDIPRTFPVTAATEILDYDLINIEGQQYIVPLRALLRMRSLHETTRNEIEFRNYRKFGTTSDIRYDMESASAEPLPSNKTEEQPITAPTAGSKTASPNKSTASSGSNPWTLPSAPPPPPQ